MAAFGYARLYYDRLDCQRYAYERHRQASGHAVEVTL